VAMLSGFGSQTYFSDCFKKQFGTTPTAVKKNASQGILFVEGEKVEVPESNADDENKITVS